MDMFQRRTTFGGGFNATSAKVMFAGFRSGLAFETLSIGYQQQVVKLWDLDGDAGNVYLVAGHPAGNANISKAIGPRNVSTAFYERYADVCRAAENNLMLQARTSCISNAGAGRDYGGQIRISMTGVTISGVSVQVSANDPIMRQSLALSFISLDWDEQESSQGG